MSSGERKRNKVKTKGFGVERVATDIKDVIYLVII